jgi:hypothetical protein
MKTRKVCALAAVYYVSMLAGAGLRADTLILKDGQKLTGQVLAIRDGVIAFERRRAQGGREVVMIDRVDVRGIELDEGENDLTPSPDLGRGSATGSPVRPPGMRERAVTVDATVAWTDTLIDAAAGQTVYFLAIDRVRWAPGRRDGPAGEHNSPAGGTRPIPSERRAALIGRIGESKDYFIVGDNRGPIRLRSSGRLYLGVNDDSLQDNAGSFRVRVFY